MKKVNLPFKLQSLTPGREFINHGMGHYNVTLKNFSSNIFFKFTKKNLPLLGQRRVCPVVGLL